MRHRRHQNVLESTCFSESLGVSHFRGQRLDLLGVLPRPFGFLSRPSQQGVGDERGRQKCDQSEYVARLSYCECVEWRLKEIVDRQKAEHRHQNSEPLLTTCRRAENDENVDEGRVSLLDVGSGLPHDERRDDENPNPQRPIDVFGRPGRLTKQVTAQK